MTEELEMTVFRPGRPGVRMVLGDREAEVMELIWARPVEQGTLVRDVFEILYAQQKTAYTTVMSTMARLVKKKLLRAKKQDQAYVYYPLSTKEEFVSGFVGCILDNLFINFSGVTLTYFKTRLDPQAPEHASQLLEEIIRRRALEEER